MKKILLILFSAIMIISFAACVNSEAGNDTSMENSTKSCEPSHSAVTETSVEPYRDSEFLFGEALLGSAVRAPVSEISADRTNEFVDENKKGSVKTDSRFFTKEISYVKSLKWNEYKYPVDHYQAKDGSAYVNYDKNGEIQAMYLPLSRAIERTVVDAESQKKASLNSLKMLEGSVENFRLAKIIDEGEDAKQFCYVKSISGVDIATTVISINSCGDLFFFMRKPTSEYSDIKIPDLPDSFYCDGASKKLSELIKTGYYDSEKATGILDCKIESKELCYLSSKDCYAIKIIARFSFDTSDASEKTLGVMIYYTLD